MERCAYVGTIKFTIKKMPIIKIKKSYLLTLCKYYSLGTVETNIRLRLRHNMVIIANRLYNN